MENQNGKPGKADIERLLGIASQKLGTTPEQLKETLSDKKATQDLLDRLGCANTKGILNNPQALQDLLKSNPKAKKCYDDLTGGGH